MHRESAFSILFPGCELRLVCVCVFVFFQFEITRNFFFLLIYASSFQWCGSPVAHCGDLPAVGSAWSLVGVEPWAEQPWLPGAVSQ